MLHDSHAEILGIRAFNHFLVEESGRLIANRERQSRYLRWRLPQEMSPQRGDQPLTIREEVRLHMYCSEAPCGDASMELTMRDQEDATPWLASREYTDMGSGGPRLRGREYFSELGIVRRKPGLWEKTLLLDIELLTLSKQEAIVSRPSPSHAPIKLRSSRGLHCFRGPPHS